MIKLNYLVLNPRFDMCVVFTANYFLMRCNILVGSETSLITDFVNLKIKLTQSFRGAHKYKMYV
jgi:hypothetical protein